MGRTADGSATRGWNGVRDDGGRRGRRSSVQAHDDARDDVSGGRADGRNVNGLERSISVVAGGALAAYALKRKDWTGLALGLLGGALVERGVSGHCAVYESLGVTTADRDGAVHAARGAEGAHDRPVQQHGRSATVDASKSQRVDRSVTIFGRSRSEIYAYWRQLENLPRIFQHLESVTEHDAKRSTWVAKAPAGRTVTWDAEIVTETRDERLSWKSLPGARVPNAGSVLFRDAPGGRGVEVHVELEYEPPAGKIGVAVARLFGEEPDIQVREDLRRYKALVETGELPVSENPGQGKRARKTEFNAQVSRGDTGADLGDLQRRAPEEAHEPQHVPQPADAERGINTTEPASWEART